MEISNDLNVSLDETVIDGQRGLFLLFLTKAQTFSLFFPCADRMCPDVINVQK